MLVVIADTSPIRYLVQIGEIEILFELYRRVLIPTSVASELNHAGAPDVVRTWMAQPPNWLETVSTPSGDHSHFATLDPGERDAILLAVNLKADLVLMDDREGVEEALSAGLSVTGTLGVLDRAAEKGLVSLPSALASLRKTNFRASAAIFNHLLAQDLRRKH